MKSDKLSSKFDFLHPSCSDYRKKINKFKLNIRIKNYGIYDLFPHEDKFMNSVLIFNLEDFICEYVLQLKLRGFCNQKKKLRGFSLQIFKSKMIELNAPFELPKKKMIELNYL